MNRPYQVACLAILLFVSTVAASGADPVAVTPPCGSGHSLDSDQVAQRLAANNAERNRQLRNFEALRQYTLDYTGFPSSRSAEMNVKVSYRAPGTKEFAVLAGSG